VNSDLIDTFLARCASLQRTRDDGPATAALWGLWELGAPLQAAYVVNHPSDDRFARIWIHLDTEGGGVSLVDAHLASNTTLTIEDLEERLGPGEEGVRFSIDAPRLRIFHIEFEGHRYRLVARFDSKRVQSVVIGFEFQPDEDPDLNRSAGADGTEPGAGRVE
jgi:hypothetical protein